MLTRITIENDGIHLTEINAHASSGSVLLGTMGSYTDQDIWDWCDENLCAPEDGCPDYQDWPVIR